MVIGFTQQLRIDFTPSLFFDRVVYPTAFTHRHISAPQEIMGTDLYFSDVRGVRLHKMNYGLISSFLVFNCRIKNVPRGHRRNAFNGLPTMKPHVIHERKMVQSVVVFENNVSTINEGVARNVGGVWVRVRKHVFNRGQRVCRVGKYFVSNAKFPVIVVSTRIQNNDRIKIGIIKNHRDSSTSLNLEKTIGD